MKFRSARHTNNLTAVREFYTSALLLDVLGEFQAHEKYNGVFIGKVKQDWHLEFTESDEVAIHKADEDDILVFYPVLQSEYDSILEAINQHGIKIQKPKNSYWEKNGVLVKDPDGFNVVISNKYAE